MHKNYMRKSGAGSELNEGQGKRGGPLSFTKAAKAANQLGGKTIKSSAAQDDRKSSDAR